MCRKTEIKKCKHKIYFVGIGGISMSGLAFFLHQKGLNISGYDDNCGEMIKKLSFAGISINNFDDLKNCDFAVVSSAIKTSHPQIELLNKFKKPIIERGELLKKISEKFPFKIGVSGTHGKTTCTAMIAHILKEAKREFSGHIGGIDSDFGNIIYNGDDIFLSEVCEFKRNIALFNSNIGIILNVDNDHLDSYGSIDELKNEFSAFNKRSNISILNGDDKFLNTLKGIKFSIKNNKADYYASHIKINENFIEYTVNGRIGPLFAVKINSVFPHDISNSLASVACALTIGIDKKYIKQGLENFKGVKRRKEIMGKIENTIFFADYAHHPTEIKDTIKMLKGRNKKVAVLFQSHTFSRTRELFDDFIKSLEEAQNLYIFDTFGARESYDEKGSGKRLSEMLKNSQYKGAPENVGSLLVEIYKNYDIIAVIGAGNLYDYVEKFIVDYKNKN